MLVLFFLRVIKDRQQTKYHNPHCACTPRVIRKTHLVVSGFHFQGEHPCTSPPLPNWKEPFASYCTWASLLFYLAITLTPLDWNTGLTTHAHYELHRMGQSASRLEKMRRMTESEPIVVDSDTDIIQHWICSLYLLITAYDKWYKTSNQGDIVTRAPLSEATPSCIPVSGQGLFKSRCRRGQFYSLST